ncbi:High-affinity nicotinic acid transporter [Sphaceloma murrayae]|uniref:High-affinity nicotinic acid transporter n=1 Tax=Sphaceloma murrayae TaxID=2082308 RepID=A0A2K1R054_9PEZI|nr:High-affinity nicotinic acid transporter [Sphaceloma murrayae]
MNSKRSSQTDKEISVGAGPSSSALSEALPSISEPQDADQAYIFLSRIQVPVHEVLAVHLPSLRRRIDYRLIPFMWLCYTMCWLDKAILNYAAVMGLPRDLMLEGNNFSNANTFFYVATTVAELPTGFILTKVPAAKWASPRPSPPRCPHLTYLQMGINVILWGVATAAVAASRDYYSLVATRVLVGVFEAAVAPCLILLISQWYTKSEQSPRFCFWYAGLGTGQIVGGLQSFGFQHVANPSFAGWRIMFVTMGSITVVLGVFTLVFLAENPMKAKFLTNAEKAALLHHISINQTGVVNRRFKWSQVRELLADVQIWWLMVITILVCTTSGVISSYSSTLLNNFGYTSKQAALLNSMSGFISILSAVGSGIGVRKGGHRWVWIVALLLPSILGAGLMSFMPRSQKSGILAGIYLVNTCTATLPHIYQWTAANIAGHTKRPVAIGLVTAAFGVASTIGPQTFQARDAPLYQPARLTVLTTLCAGAALTGLLGLFYRRENTRRDAVGGSEGPADAERWGNLTDKMNAKFRYVL